MKTSSYMLEQDMARHVEQTVAATQGASGWLGVTLPFRWTERFLKKPGGKVLRYHRKEGSLSLLLSFWLGDGQLTCAVWGSQNSSDVNGAPHVTLTSHTEGRAMERKSWMLKSLDGCFALPELYPCVVINSFLSGRRLGGCWWAFL